jgi:tetratricopeptide (TPR) repeat protein
MIGIVIGIVGVLVAVISIVVMVVIPLLQSRSKKKRILKNYYKLIWKKSSALKPKALLERRPFHKAYHKRDEDNKILEALSARRNVLIVGPPLSGKTRAAYEALKKLNRACDVLIARSTDIDLEKFLFPKHLKFWRPKVLIIDDLHRFVEQQNFEHLLRIAEEKGTTIVATCRSGFECDKAKAEFARKGLGFEMIFAENIFELGQVSEEEAQNVADEAEVEWGKVRFDGTIGSVFMKLEEMEKRFKSCSSEEKTLLRVLRKLYISGVYEENQVFPLKWVKSVAKTDELEGTEPQWTDWMEKLEAKELLTRQKEAVQAEEVHLQDIVKPEIEAPELKLFGSMLSALAGLPDALFRLGDRAYTVGTVGEAHLDKARYMKIAIGAYQEALKVYTLDRFPMDYGMTQNNLGVAYRTLGEVESKAENCRLAIGAYEQALKVRTLDRFPMDYGMTQNNLGVAYRTLAEVEDKTENCKRAIQACEQALKVRTLDRFPIQYAATQNNVGIAYGTLSGVKVEAKGEHSKTAIEAFEQALRVYTLDRFPIQYAATQNNLGNAYRILAEVEAKTQDCRRAIEAHEEALKVYTLDRFPMDYGMTQNNLGNAYSTLGQVESKAENCKLAIGAYEEALKVRTLDRFPMDYGMTQNNLGTAFWTLAEEADKAINCGKASVAFREALKVCTKDELPQDYEMVQNNLRNLRVFCEGK